MSTATAAASTATTATVTDAGAGTTEAARPFEIWIDGDCPVCRWEGRAMQKLDNGRGRLRVVDITAEGFDPAAHGLSWDEVMGKIHGVGEDGSLVTGMEVFRRSYQRVGLGWLWAPTGWPVLRPVFDVLYRWFARNRWWLTGRGKWDCETGKCRV